MGQIGIAFKFPILPQHQHIIIDENPDLNIPHTFNPRRCVVWGLMNSTLTDDEPISGANTKTFGGSDSSFVEIHQLEFVSGARNEFLISPSLPGLGELWFTVLIIEILDNWGGPLTSLHRVHFICQ